MFNKIIAIFKSGNIFDIISKVQKGLASAIVVLNNLSQQMESLKSNKKLLPYVEKVTEALGSFKAALDKVVIFFGKPELVAKTKSLSLEDSLENLDSIMEDLKKSKV